MAFNYSPKIITDGLVLYLDAANTRSYPTTGTIWSDLSRNNNNGTLINGPTFNSANGGSIVFDGSNDVVDNITQSIPILYNTPFSTSIVFRTTSVGTAHLIGNWNVLVTPGWRIDVSSGRIRFFIANAGGGGSIIQTNNTIYNNGSVYCVCCVFDGSGNVNGMRVYVNSIETTTTIAGGVSPGTLINSKITLGASQVNTSNFTNYLLGNIYQTKIYNRAISATEILQNYNATKSRFGLT
jgi:hypothetical protein